MNGPLLEVEGVTKLFPITRSVGSYLTGGTQESVHALDGVSFQVGPGETLGLIGESGSGKTTLGWIAVRLLEPTSGTVRFDGREVTGLRGEALRRWRRNVQIVFQDPVGSLDPRLRAWQIVSEPLTVQEKLDSGELRERVTAILPSVGLPVDCLDQYPHEFSGGGRQRLALARALILDPRLVVLDEPTSALDVAVQAQVLNRLVALQRERGYSYLLITHNVAAVRYLADRVMVLYLGLVAETGPVRDVLEHPVHPYTKALLAAAPVPDPRRRRTLYRIAGEIPTLVHPPPGCRFAGRCPFVIDRCRVESPALREVSGWPGRKVACHRAEEVGDVGESALRSESPPPGAPASPGSAPEPG
ncbi:MAG TPA: oligopeptide/dipeptide ABC transporter ATP-binding protein [Thermoplasmata archaeon]|nr:oligopeptide/dipeptide ABC transporter ATP-binding protein [Thermoplasmata archaeon]